MNEFDDREVRDALRRRAGAATDGLGLEAARAAVVARAGRVRRRRAAVAGGATMAGMIAAASFVIGPGTDSVVTTPSDRTNVSPPTSADSPVDETTAVSTDPTHTTPDRNVIATTPPGDTSPSPTTTLPSAVPPPGTASSTSVPSTTAPAAPGTVVVAPPTSPQPAPSTTATAPAGPEPFTETYPSAGGSITLHWDGLALSLERVAPADGFDPEVEHQLPDRIRVRFRGDDRDFRIEIRVEDGEIVRVE